MSIYSRISELFDIKDLLQTKNPIRKAIGITKVEIDKGKGKGSIQIHITEETRGKQRILLFDQDQQGKSFGHYRYTNRTYQNDSGDIVQFIANRLKGNRLNDAVKLLNKHDYQNNAVKWKKDVDFEVSKPGNRNRETKPIDLEKFDNLRDIDKLIMEEQPHLLEKRNISNDVLLHPNFVGKVKVYDATVPTAKGPITFTNVFFPKYNKDKILGAEIKTGAKSNSNLNLGIDYLLWHSNKPESVEKVALFESAIDAISHFQMNPDSNSNTWYFSTNGNFYEAKQSFFFEALKGNALTPDNYTLILGTDRDYEGLNYDFAVYNHALSSIYPDKGQSKQEFFSMAHIDGMPSIQFHSHDNKLNTSVNAWFFNIQDYFNNIYVNDRDNHHITIKSSNDRINLVFPSKTKLQNASKKLSASILRNIPVLKSSNIKSHKATYMGKPQKDWNQALTLNSNNSSKTQNKGRRNKKSTFN